MFKKLSTSYNLVKISFKYIAKDPELLLYSILSILSSIAILITFVGVDYMSSGYLEGLLSGSQLEESSANMIITGMVFAYYFIFSFITFFFNTAIITSVQRRNDGYDNKIGDGLRDSMKHLKQIFIWSLINATVTTILNLLQRKFGENSIVGGIIVGIIGGAWNILTFFSFPLMIVNDMGPKQAVKESANLFKKTWGERAIIHVGVGLMFGVLYVLVFILSIGIMFMGAVTTGIAIIIFGTILVVIISNTSDIIIKTILLHYAQTGSLPADVENASEIINIAGEK